MKKFNSTDWTTDASSEMLLLTLQMCNLGLCFGQKEGTYFVPSQFVGEPMGRNEFQI